LTHSFGDISKHGVTSAKKVLRQCHAPDHRVQHNVGLCGGACVL